MDYFYEEEFYNEPNEFEKQINEFKESLLKSVKQEYLSEMEQLKKENKELQVVRENLDTIEKEYKEKSRRLDRERHNMEMELKNKTLSELMSDSEVIMYKAYPSEVAQDKCSQCNENRQIEYVTPLGNKAFENCSCSIKKRVYIPEKYIRYSFSLVNSGGHRYVNAFYIKNGSDRDEYFSYDDRIRAENIYSSEMKFDQLNSYNTFFKTVDECQSYCDFLNKTQ
ncbi:hypothetical protein [Bacillus altitudinis]|uniref:hypothetical protein n=1 Tax=Bacillus altitudinis TaxID=293387 RepID=UPI00345A7E9F